MSNLQIFKELCMDLHKESNKPYAHVILKVLQTRYASLLPEKMELSEIAYVLDTPEKTVSNIYTKIVGKPKSKSLLKVLAKKMNLKDFVYEKVIEDGLDSEMLR